VRASSISPLPDERGGDTPGEARIRELLPWLVAVALFMENLDATDREYGGAGDFVGARVAP